LTQGGGSGGSTVLGAGTAVIGKVGIDQTTPGTTDSVTLKASESHLGEVSGNLISKTVEETRPANTDAYTAGDVVSNNVTTTTLMQFANIFRVSGGTGYIVGIRVSTDKKSITPRLRMHLFNASNPTIAADNAAFKEVYADDSKRLTYYDMPAMNTAVDATNSDMSRSFDMTCRIPVYAAAGSRDLFLAKEVLDAFTPASGQKIKVTLYLDNN
jgi:hypothetical protein